MKNISGLIWGHSEAFKTPFNPLPNIQSSIIFCISPQKNLADIETMQGFMVFYLFKIY